VKADSEYIPSTMVELTDKQAEEVMGMIERLEEDDDVQKVFHNLK
jgi:transcriptional/translational regulatory protein YebC/TACO1